MTTETVTVMFTDLVGSTALLARVGDVAADVLRREHFELTRAAISAHRGREVKNLGDGLVVVFDSAADAVAAAADVQRAFERRNRTASEPLLVRVAAAAGDAAFHEGEYFGAPVAEAAGLCSVAGGGEIVVTDVVRLLAGSRGTSSFESLGAIAVSDLAQPVPACRLVWERSEAAAAQPLPARLAAAASDVFVGRARERRELVAAWEAAAAGERHVVLLSGEPGIGKTTLSAHLAADVHAAGATVAYGRCDADLGIPYQPWVQALGQLAAALPAEGLRSLALEHDGTLGRLLPALAGHLPEVTDGEDGGAARFALFEAVADLLATSSLDQPMLVVIDDLHWADRPSLQLLKHLVSSDRPMRVAIVGTYRDTDVGAGHPLSDLLADLHRERGIERLHLRGLGHGELLDLLERIAGHEMPEEGVAMRDAVLAETAGNPFFVLEILRHLADTGAISQDADGRWSARNDVRAAGLPVSVREVVGRRIGALGPEAERILSMAAVIGRDFDIDLLSAVAQRDEDVVIDCCDAAVAAAVLETTEDPERYTFAHALIEHTLYGGLSPARRSRAHRLVGERLEQRHAGDPGPRAGELAHHWGAAKQAGDPAKAMHYALLAARRALEQLAPDEALRRYVDALASLDAQVAADASDRLRAEVLVGLGIAQRQCGVPEHRRTLLEAARLADDIGAVDLLVRSAAANTREFSSVIGGIDDERVAVIRRALARVGDTDPAARARLLVVLAIELTYRAPLDDRLAMIEEAIGLARRSGDDYLLLQVLQRSCDAAVAPRTLPQRTAWATEAGELSDGRSDLEAVLNARVDLMIAALESGDPTTMHRCAAEVEDLVRRIPQPELRWVVSMHRAMLLMLRGDLDDAEQEAEAAFALAVETGQPDPLGVYGPQLVIIRFFQGRAGEVLPLIEAMVASEEALQAHVAGLTLARALEGDRVGATMLLDDALAAGFPTQEDQGWAIAHASWAEAAARVGHRGAARVLHERLRPYATRLVTTNVTVQPSVAHHLGLLDHCLGRHDDAATWFDIATGIHERMGSPLFVAISEVAQARLHADLGAADRARDLASTALATASARGYGQVAADAASVLRAHE